MWETAPKFGALLVFAEHRYFGKSVPYGKDVMKHMTYLSSSQALADYATLIRHVFGHGLRSPAIRFLKERLPAKRSAVISFGGSYGGMLSSWFRMKVCNSFI